MCYFCFNICSVFLMISFLLNIRKEMSRTFNGSFAVNHYIQERERERQTDRQRERERETTAYRDTETERDR